MPRSAPERCPGAVGGDPEDGPLSEQEACPLKGPVRT
jgi:hypothetical protein